jgi:dCMP deaminase
MNSQKGKTMSTDNYFMEKARAISQNSPDTTKVGCIIADQENRIVAAGCNEFPAGVKATPERLARPEKYKWIEHSERNAIYQAARAGRSLQGCTAYLTWFPCMDCARALIQAGITELVGIQPDLDNPTWGEDFKRVETLMAEAALYVEIDRLRCGVARNLVAGTSLPRRCLLRRRSRLPTARFGAIQSGPSIRRRRRLVLWAAPCGNP